MKTFKRLLAPKTLALLGALVGSGFLAGFLCGYIYGTSRQPLAAPHISAPPTKEASEAGKEAQKPADTSEDIVSIPDLISDDEGEDEEYISASYRKAVSADAPAQDLPISAGGLELTDHQLGDDENGVYISGTIENRSGSAYDAVRVYFDLCDAKGEPYAVVGDANSERMENGDTWGFIAYVPYTDMRRMDSYRLQGIMGVKK